MVKSLLKNEVKIFECERCHFQYASESDAKDCETWCSKHMSCNLEIIKKALPMEESHEGRKNG